jgi:hypothetical protein
MEKPPEIVSSWGKELIQSIISRLKAPVELRVLIFILLASAVYIWTGKPYIDVPGTTLAFTLPGFTTCDIGFLETIPVRSYAVALQTGSDSPGVAGNSVSYDKETNGLVIQNPYLNLSPASSSPPSYLVNIYLGQALGAEIGSVAIDGVPVDLRMFSTNNLSTANDFIRVRYIRKDLAKLILNANDPFSNVVLTCLALAIVLLVGKLVQMELTAYCYAGNRFDQYVAACVNINKLDDEERKDTRDKYNRHWHEWTERFRFWQVLGPAIGFILTVSSLIQALHPAMKQGNDLGGFLKGLHVAMISTFLGLLLRIVSLEAERVNDRLLFRVNALLDKPVSRAAHPRHHP